MGTVVAPRGWPADVIHVNEDGWVLINRGCADGVSDGMRLLVVGTGTRELRDLFAGSHGNEAPVVLRTRRTYELLEVVHVEERCAVLVAERAPAARRPMFYTGPEGELLVWVPLPEGYTWPPSFDGEVASEEDESVAGDDTAPAADLASETEDAMGADEPPGTADQQDQRWEEALPLNSVSVGDIVVPAVPVKRDSAAVASPATAVTDTSGDVTSSETHAWDRHYDWMQPKASE
jgi:hypothetical protein